MHSNDIGKISSRTTKKKLIEMSSTKGVALEKRINAINLLATKKDVDPSAFFGKILKDDKESVIVKSNLVLKLGYKLKSVRALEKFLGNQDLIINRSILQVLAYKGDANSIKKIEAFTKGKGKNTLEIKKAQFAKTLISYRLGDNKEILPKSAPEAFENFRGIDAQAIKKQQLTTPKATKIISELNDAYMAVPLAATKAQKLVCQGKTLSIFLNKAVATNTFDFNTNGIVASICEADYCPGGHFIKYHVLLNKEGKTGNHRVHLINPNGQVLMEGLASKKGNQFAFSVKALKRAGSTPILFDASFDLDTTEMNITEAKSGVNQRLSSKIQLSPLNGD